MYPKDVLSSSPSVEQQTCFMLMPFAEEFRPISDAIVKAVEGVEIGFSRCRRADEMFGGGNIMKEVIENIARAEIVIADVTSRNANVFYELGIAHAFKDIKSVLIITQSIEDVPFDLRHLRHIVYEPTPSGLLALKAQLIASIRQITPADLRFTIAEGGSYTIPTRLPGPDRYLYDIEVGPVSTGRNFAKFRLVVRRYGVDTPGKIISSDDHGIESGYALDIPGLGWKLKLDDVSHSQAHFCICEPSD